MCSELKKSEEAQTHISLRRLRGSEVRHLTAVAGKANERHGMEVGTSWILIRSWRVAEGL